MRDAREARLAAPHLWRAPPGAMPRRSLDLTRIDRLCYVLGGLADESRARRRGSRPPAYRWASDRRTGVDRRSAGARCARARLGCWHTRAPRPRRLALVAGRGRHYRSWSASAECTFRKSPPNCSGCSGSCRHRGTGFFREPCNARATSPKRSAAAAVAIRTPPATPSPCGGVVRCGSSPCNALICSVPSA